MNSFTEDVFDELKAMKALGMDVPTKAFMYIVKNDIEQYNNMRVSEAADLILQLA